MGPVSFPIGPSKMSIWSIILIILGLILAAIAGVILIVNRIAIAGWMWFLLAAGVVILIVGIILAFALA